VLISAEKEVGLAACQRKKATGIGGFLRSCAGHWPPSEIGPMVVPPCPSQACPAGLSILGLSLGGDSLTGGPSIRGLTSIAHQPVHHWHTLISNQKAIPSFLYFQ
jgi:hypothetical protein